MSVTNLSSHVPVFRGVTAGFVVVAVLFAVRLSFDGFRFSSGVQDFLTLSFSVVVEALPFVILGVLLSSLFQVFLPVEKVFRWLPKSSVLRRIVLSFVGFLLPVCECGNVPLARGMVMKGMSVSDAVTFLLAAPVVNPITVFTTFQVFGWEDGIFLGRLLGVLFVAHVIGWLFSLHPSASELLTTKFAAACAHHHEPDKKDRLVSLVSFFRSELGKMLPLLLIGGFVAGAVQVFLPREILYSVGQHLVLSLLVMVLLGVVVAVCSNVDSFFALTFVGLFLPGAILVFLIVGPLMDVKMLTLLRTTFRWRAVALMCTVIVSAALAFGVGVNVLWG